jgi:hypothetical protein
MSTDCQKLNHGGIAERQVVDWVEIDLRHQDPLAEPAVRMHAQHLDRGAAVWLPLPAGHASAARDIRVDNHPRAYRETGAGSGFRHLARELVTHDAGVGQEGVLALVYMVVSAANADMPDVHGGPAFGRVRRARTFDNFEVPGSGADKRLHIKTHRSVTGR